MQGAAIVRHVVTFLACCARSGSRHRPGRVEDAIRGLGAVDHATGRDVYFTLRQTLVSRQDEPSCSTGHSSPGSCAGRLRRSFVRSRHGASPIGSRGTRRGGDDADDAIRPSTPHELGASGHELLRGEGLRRDDAGEFERVRRLMAAIARRGRAGSRDGARRTPEAIGSIRVACAESRFRTGDEPIEQPWKSRKVVHRKLVVLCDISGSMDAYARALLFYLHAIVGSGSVFAFGTASRGSRSIRDARPRGWRSRGRMRSPWTGERHANRRLARGSSTRCTGDGRSHAERSS